MADMRTRSSANRIALAEVRPTTNSSATSGYALSVVGLGYVGAVSVACFAGLGFRVIGVDQSQHKVLAIAAGRTPIVEQGLGDLLAQGVANGLISTTLDLAHAVVKSDVTLLSVGTPTAADGGADLSQVRAASRAIGEAIARKSTFHTIVLRCSVPPGTTLGVVLPEIEAGSGKKAGKGFGIAFVPEFLREGVAVADFHAPPKTVIAATDALSLGIVRAIFSTVSEPIHETTIEIAETLKYVDNVWHATKVVFANEVGRLCHGLGVDSHGVMDLFVKDTKLNLSPYYMKPGFAFGGSCLPKEVRAVQHIAAERGIALPLVESLLPSNRAQIEQAVQMAAPFKGKRIAMLGLTFKPATDDVRESPLLALYIELKALGHDVVAFDPNVKAGPAFKAYLASVVRDADVADQLDDALLPRLSAATESADVFIVGHATAAFREAMSRRRPDQHVIDLARIVAVPQHDRTYHGIAW